MTQIETAPVIANTAGHSPVACQGCGQETPQDALTVDGQGLQFCRRCVWGWLRSPLSVTLDGRDLEPVLEEVRRG